MTAKNGVSLNWGGFDKAMGKAALKLGNTKSLMNSVGEALVSGTLQRFADEEDPQGQKWPKSGRAANEGGQTLTDTGRLHRLRCHVRQGHGGQQPGLCPYSSERRHHHT